MALMKKFYVLSNVTNEGRARAHDPGSAIVRVRMNLDLGTFAPQIIRSAWTEKSN